MKKTFFLNLFIISLIVYELFFEYYRISSIKDTQKDNDVIRSYVDSVGALKECKKVVSNNCDFERVILNN